MLAATTLFSAPICPNQCPLSTKHHSSITLNKFRRLLSSAGISTETQVKPPRIVLRASSLSSNPTTTVESQEEEESSSSPPPSDQAEPINSSPIGGCKACGKAEIERGCNGEGRIQGGIATVPGFGWWPIKAYRPCPGLVATGGRYRRQGQSMDEVAGFGGVPRVSSKVATATTTAADQTQSSEKDGPRKFKR